MRLYCKLSVVAYICLTRPTFGGFVSAVRMINEQHLASSDLHYFKAFMKAFYAALASLLRSDGRRQAGLYIVLHRESPVPCHVVLRPDEFAQVAAFVPATFIISFGGGRAERDEVASGRATKAALGAIAQRDELAFRVKGPAARDVAIFTGDCGAAVTSARLWRPRGRSCATNAAGGPRPSVVQRRLVVIAHVHCLATR